MQTFLHNGIACEELATEALRIGGQVQTCADHLRFFQVFDEILARIGGYFSLDRIYILLTSIYLPDSAQNDANRLFASFTCLLEGNDLGVNSFLRPIFEAFLPVIQSRVSNLAVAHDLVLCSKTNLGIALHIQSLKLTS